MAYETTICTVRQTLCTTMTQVDFWFEKSEETRQFKAASGGWNIDEVLEHITLTNKYLIRTLRKWVVIVERRALRGDLIPEEGESDLERLENIGQRASFAWIRPEHMEPTGEPSSDQVRKYLYRQLGECLILLERIGDGKGALGRITMSVDELGKIDLYQWMYFLALHAKRHLQQMEAIAGEYKNSHLDDIE